MRGSRLVDRVARLWQSLDGDRRALITQLLRYGVAGLGVTFVQIGVYNLMLGLGHLRPLVANTVATVIAMLIGYTIHSRFSFRGHGSRDSVTRTGGRFVAANLLGYAVNSFWVWLITVPLHLSAHLASLPMIAITPFALFYLNRRWVFE